jgi:hypothetical protein
VDRRPGEPPGLPFGTPGGPTLSHLGRQRRATTTVRPARGEAISFSISIFGYRVRRTAQLFLAGMRILLDIHWHTYDSSSVKKRTTVWLPEELVGRLKKLSLKTGAPMAELFRRAVEAYLKRQK